MPDSFDFSQRPEKPQGPVFPIITVLICAICILMTIAFYAGAEARSGPMYALAQSSYVSSVQIWNGHYSGLVTNIFLHGDVFHLLFNLYWLWMMGKILESTLPPLAYAGFILAAAVVSSACQLLFGSSAGIGMSGVGYALFGLMWAGRGRYPSWNSIATRKNAQLFVIWGIYCVIATETHIMQIANAAHGAGALFGLCIGWIFVAPRRRPIWLAPLVLLAAASTMALVWVPWSGDWNFARASRAFTAGRYQNAIAGYYNAIKHGEDANTCWDNISRAWNNIAVADAAQGDDAAALKAEEQSEKAKNQMELVGVGQPK